VEPKECDWNEIWATLKAAGDLLATFRYRYLFTTRPDPTEAYCAQKALRKACWELSLDPPELRYFTEETATDREALKNGLSREPWRPRPPLSCALHQGRSRRRPVAAPSRDKVCRCHRTSTSSSSGQATLDSASRPG
jgi:hypothetical protein